MPSLFVTLGTSPAIVPEAFLFPYAHFDAVHVLTSEKPDTSFIQTWFRDQAPHVHLTIGRVAGFLELQSEADHFHFEEVLYRWLLAGDVSPAERYISLAGGFKTMSAAMQKAAAVLGAAEVFHVLCDLPPSRQPATAAEIEGARVGGHLHWIRLGPESGWPQFRAGTAADVPLVAIPSLDQPCEIRLSAPDLRFRDRVRAVVERSHRIAENWSSLAGLPFAELATLAPARLAWLDVPIDPSSPLYRSWIAALPKIELHCHLGGFATHGADLDAIRSSADEPSTLPAVLDRSLPEGWPLPPKPIGLEAYRKLGDNNGSELLKDPGCLRRQCELLYRHFLEQHVVYAEVRCSPANYADPARGRSPLTVLAEIRGYFQRLMDESRPGPEQPPRCHVNLLVIATRQDRGDYRTAIGRHLGLAVTAAENWTADADCRVVGVDLAGFEDASTRAHYFRDDFKAAHRCGLALTVHAGENDDAEGIWSAVLDLSARRLGHALSLRESRDLLGTVAARGIAVEMCPYANVQIKGYALDGAVPAAATEPMYPLLEYLRAGVPVTVNTDNIGISAASLGDNLLLAARLCPGLTPLHVLRLLRNALDAAFVRPRHRTIILESVTATLARSFA
jgi:adenosine deaminase